MIMCIRYIYFYTHYYHICSSLYRLQCAINSTWNISCQNSLSLSLRSKAKEKLQAAATASNRYIGAICSPGTGVQHVVQHTHTLINRAYTHAQLGEKSTLFRLHCNVLYSFSFSCCLSEIRYLTEAGSQKREREGGGAATAIGKHRKHNTHTHTDTHTHARTRRQIASGINQINFEGGNMRHFVAAAVVVVVVVVLAYRHSCLSVGSLSTFLLLLLSLPPPLLSTSA